MGILNNFPHTANIYIRSRQPDGKGGSRDSFALLYGAVACWRQVAGERQITEFMKRGISVTDRVYFLSNLQLDERHLIQIGGDVLEVRSRAIPDASAGLSVVWRVMAEYTSTGSIA